jgi:hypothetical protein
MTLVEVSVSLHDLLSTRHSGQVLTEHEISQKIFGKYPNIKFHENPYSESRVDQCGETDRHDEAYE